MLKIRFVIYRPSLNNLQTRKKATKNTNQLELHFSYMTTQKRSNINIASDLGTYHEYDMQFTDPTPTIYWYAKRVKLTFLNMPVLNSIQ